MTKCGESRRCAAFSAFTRQECGRGAERRCKILEKTPALALDSARKSPYNSRVAHPGVAQLVARMVRDHEAVGSNPATRTKNRQNLVILAVFLIGKLQKFLSDFSDHMFSHRWQKISARRRLYLSCGCCGYSAFNPPAFSRSLLAAISALTSQIISASCRSHSSRVCA